MQADTWLSVAAFVTWLASGVPAGLAIADGRFAGVQALAWASAFAAFGVAFGLVCYGRRRGVREARALVFVQAAAGLAMVATTNDGFAAATLVVVAAQLPGLFPPRAAAAWVAVQTALIVILFWWIFGRVLAFTAGGAYWFRSSRWQLPDWRFASARRVGPRTRQRELMATRSLLAENSRVAERLHLRISRHARHHLTALSLQLEVASRLASGPAADRVHEAHAITRLYSATFATSSVVFASSRFNLAEAVRVSRRLPPLDSPAGSRWHRH